MLVCHFPMIASFSNLFPVTTLSLVNTFGWNQKSPLHFCSMEWNVWLLGEPDSRQKWLGPRTCPCHLSIQETRSWDVPNQSLTRYVCDEGHFWVCNVVCFGAVLRDKEIMEARREVYKDSLRDHSGYGRVRS